MIDERFWKAGSQSLQQLGEKGEMEHEVLKWEMRNGTWEWTSSGFFLQHESVEKWRTRWFQRCFLYVFFDFHPESRGTWPELDEFFLLNWLENHLEISSSNFPLEVWKPMKTWQLGDSYLNFWAYTPYTYYIPIIYPIHIYTYTYLIFGLFWVYWDYDLLHLLAL